MVASFSSQMNIKKEEIRLTSNQLANKYEHRNVDCDIEYHLPDKGKKTVRRQDTLESWIENMSDIDWNLWNDKIAKEVCDIAYNSPSEGMKTFTHRQRPELSFVEHMTAADFDKLQGKLFNENESELGDSPNVEQSGSDSDLQDIQDGSQENPFKVDPETFDPKYKSKKKFNVKEKLNETY